MQRFYQLARVTQIYYPEVTLPYRVLYSPFCGASPNRLLYQLESTILYVFILDYTLSGCLKACHMGWGIVTVATYS